MDYSFNSVEIIPDLKAAAAFVVNSSEVFKESEDISPVIIDKDLSFMPWGADSNLPYRVLDLIELDETLSSMPFPRSIWCNCCCIIHITYYRFNFLSSSTSSYPVLPTSHSLLLLEEPPFLLIIFSG